ncbi:hypothetical protein GW796_10700 [archaeon]|nr:hypothetical protein [archaeon]NCQ52331.1 hypothetical protein [archaeon]
MSIDRIALEGVLQEAIASNNTCQYFIFSLAELSKALKIKSKEVKPLITNADLFSSFIGKDVENNIFKSNNENRESILISIAASK